MDDVAWMTTKHLKRFAEEFSSKAMSIFAKKTDIPKALPADGGDADTVNGYTVENDVPAEAKFTDTVYTHPTTAGNKHIPAGGAFGQVLKWKSNGEAEWGDETDTQYGSMTGATASAPGTSGLIPPPAKGQQDCFLKGDGTWEKLEEATKEDIAAIIAGTFKKEEV